MFYTNASHVSFISVFVCSYSCAAVFIHAHCVVYMNEAFVISPWRRQRNPLTLLPRK